MANDPQQSVIDFVEDTLQECRVNAQSGSESRLFNITVRLATCLLAINMLLLLLTNDQQSFATFTDVFTTLSSLYMIVENRLQLVRRSGSHLISFEMGRPRIDIDFHQVESLLELDMSLHEVACFLGVSRTTLWRRLSDANLSASRFTDIDDNTLDLVIASITHNSPNVGISMLTGHLRSANIHVSRRRIRNSLVRLSPLNVLLRHLTTVHRRQYTVPGPNSLWHIDGHHSLIRWRMVIRGGVDGYSRMIVFLHCSNNNRASTVLPQFMQAVQSYGWPCRVRSDQGLENIEVARAMIRHRGLGRRSHITGASVHNQRIERLWRDTFNSVAHLYYSMFYDMEDTGCLDPFDDRDLFCLHYIFLPRIQCQLQQFVHSWNRHPLRTERNQSPITLWTNGIQEALHNPCDTSNSSILEGMASFGTDADGPPANPFDQGAVNVPEINIDLSEDQLQVLRSQFDPLSSSDCYGLDHYIALRHAIHQLISPL